MKNVNMARLLAIAIPCVVLAIILTLQALSGIATRRAPEQAAALFPVNGLAQEQRAFREFRSDVAEGVDLNEAASYAAVSARSGLKYDPLAPKAYALLALATDDPEKRSAILTAAKKLNRRDISLQGLVLEEHLEDGEFQGVVSTLDELLRVHPDFHETFFPILIDAIKVDEAAPLFPGILTGEASWHLDFVRDAARDDEALINLASIRSEIPIDDRPFDSLLITGLARIGEMDTSLRLYQERVESRRSNAERKALKWVDEYPPFDWSLIDQRDFRAQPTRNGEDLELYARSGQGGVMARRVIEAPQAPLTISSKLTMRATGRSEAVNLYLRCVGVQDRFFEEPFEEGENEWRVEEIPADCSQIVIEVAGRALRGEPTLRAEISPLKFD